MFFSFVEESFVEDVKDISSESLIESSVEILSGNLVQGLSENAVDSSIENSAEVLVDNFESSSVNSLRCVADVSDSDITGSDTNNFSTDEGTEEKEEKDVDSAVVKSIEKTGSSQKQYIGKQETHKQGLEEELADKQTLGYNNNFRDKINLNLGLPSSIEVEYSDFEKCVAAANLAKWMQKSSPFAIDDKELIANVIRKINSGEEGVEKWLDYRFFLKDSYAGSSHKDGVFGFDAYAAKKMDDELSNSSEGGSFSGSSIHASNNDNDDPLDKDSEDKLDSSKKKLDKESVDKSYDTVSEKSSDNSDDSTAVADISDEDSQDNSDGNSNDISDESSE